MTDKRIYATYEDDGADGPSGQALSYQMPARRLLIFKNMNIAMEYRRGLQRWGNARKNPRITGFYSADPDEVLQGAWEVKTVTPARADRAAGPETD